MLRPRAARPVLLVYVVLMTGVLLQPDAAVAINVVTWVDSTVHELGAPAVLSAPGRMEAVVNAALFVPFATLALFALPRLAWSEVVVASFVSSMAVEVVQGLFLAHRSATAIDVVSNTAGALVGAGLSQLLRRRMTRRAA